MNRTASLCAKRVFFAKIYGILTFPERQYIDTGTCDGACVLDFFFGFAIIFLKSEGP